MRKTEYVTCSVCGYRFAGKIPPGGDGSILIPRKHYKRIPRLSLYRMHKNVLEICPGANKPAKEYVKEERNR